MADFEVEDHLGALIVSCLSLTILLTILCYRYYRTKQQQQKHPPNSTSRGVEVEPPPSEPHRKSHVDVLVETLCVLFVNTLVLFVIQMNGFLEAKWTVLAVVGASFLATVAWVFVNTSPWGVNANSESDTKEQSPEEEEDTSTSSSLMGMKQRLSPRHMRNNKISFEESNYLGDFEYDVYRALLLALGQFLLLAMYVAGILEANGNRESPEPGDAVLSGSETRFYTYGILIQIAYVVGLDKFKESVFLPVQWAHLFAAAREGHELVLEGAEEDDIEEGGFRKKLTYGDWLLWVSFLLVTAINIAGFLVILVCLPIQLTYSESRVDFVLNSIAAFFLVEMDDLQGTKKFWARPATTPSSSTLQKGQESSREIEDISEMENVSC